MLNTKFAILKETYFSSVNIKTRAEVTAHPSRIDQRRYERIGGYSLTDRTSFFDDLKAAQAEIASLGGKDNYAIIEFSIEGDKPKKICKMYEIYERKENKVTWVDSKKYTDLTKGAMAVLKGKYEDYTHSPACHAKKYK